MTRLRLALAALLAVTAAALATMTVQASSPVQGAGEDAWHYNGTSYSWNCHDFPKRQWAYFLISYDNGHPTFESADGLGCTNGQFPGYVHPDTPAQVGCGWQHWLAYQGGPGPLNNYTYQPTLTPPSSLVLARGSLYVCPGGAA